MGKPRVFGVAAVVLACFTAGCATAPPVDKSRLASVHNIFFEAVGEPPSAFYLKGIENPPPAPPLTRAHVAVDARNAVGAALIREGYQFAPDAKSADAVLSINIEAAMYGPDKPFHQDCKPSMLIAVTLKDATGHSILQREYFYADVSTENSVGWVILRADPKYTNPDCSGYSPELLMAAFHDAVPLLAQAVGAEMLKP